MFLELVELEFIAKNYGHVSPGLATDFHCKCQGKASEFLLLLSMFADMTVD